MVPGRCRLGPEREVLDNFGGATECTDTRKFATCTAVAGSISKNLLASACLRCDGTSSATLRREYGGNERGVHAKRATAARLVASGRTVFANDGPVTKVPRDVDTMSRCGTTLSATLGQAHILHGFRGCTMQAIVVHHAALAMHH